MDIKKTEAILLTAFCTLITIPILYIFRFADNNTFTSWRWVFSGVDLLHIFLFLVIGVFCAYALSMLSSSCRHSYIFLFLLSYASIIPLWNAPESIIDASRYFLQAKALKEYGIGYFLKEWGHDINAWTDMPVIPFLYGLIFKFFGEVRIYIQIFNTLLFASAVALTCFIGSELWDEETGFNAGLFLIGMPYLLIQTPLMLVDVPTMFFIALSIFTFIKVLKNGGALWTAFSSLSMFLAIFSKYSAWLMLSVIPVISIVFPYTGKKEKIIRTFTVMGISVLLSVTVFYMRYDFFRQQIEILGTYQLSGLGRWQESFVSTFFFQIHPFVTGLAIYAAYKAIKEKDKRFLAAGWFLILVVLFQIKRIRYILPIFPLFALMASYGTNKIKAKEIRRFVSLCAVISSLIIVYGAYLPFLNKTGMANLKEAGKYLNKLDDETVEVYSLPQKSSTGNTFAVIPILDYFTDKKILSRQEEWVTSASGGSKSSLRFTWEMKKPSFYSGHKQRCPRPLLVISSEKTDIEPYRIKYPLSAPPQELKRFHLSADVFRFQTFITLFEIQDCP